MLKMTTVAGGAPAIACALFLSTLIETGCVAQQSGGSVAGTPSQAESEISGHLTEGVAPPLARSVRLVAHHHAGEAMNSLSGEVETNGLSVLDVTDPAQPALLHHEPPMGEATYTQHLQVCDGSAHPRAFRGGSRNNRSLKGVVTWRCSG